MNEDKFINDAESINIVIPQCNSCIHKSGFMKCDKDVEVNSSILFNDVKCDLYQSEK